MRRFCSSVLRIYYANMPDGYQPIENYGVIGNLQTIALVGVNGSIDFLCFPYFDSPSLFGGLLDAERGGHFSLAPVFQNSRPKQIYLSNSNILLTRFLSPEGVAEVSDYMPVSLESGPNREPVRQLIRSAKCIRGEVRFQMSCDPKFDYGRAKHRVEVLSPEEVRLVPEIVPGLGSVRLRAQTPLEIKEDGRIVADFVLRAGGRVFFILDGHEDSPHGIDAAHEGALFKETLNFWQTWLAQSNYRGRWREVVDRSALVLKLLTSERYGSIVAAPTFGLPEAMGGVRNWDYRYTWIRDASFTLYALIRLGFVKEAKAFGKWLKDRCRELGPKEALQIMFGLDGRRHLPETILSHWEGYRKSSPVRIGNGAAEQLQLDIYGELLDSVYLYDKYGEPISHELWLDLSRLLEWVCDNWDQPDEGIWEVRGGVQHLFYSRLMCWVAVDRGLRLAAKRSFPAPVQRWAATRDAIYNQIHTEFWNEEMKSFVQVKGGDAVDAATLLAPLVRFISPTDPRWLSTLEAIEKYLLDDSLVYRYRGDDGLTGNEGTFGICSFWFIECLARSGDVKRARFLFEKMLGYANHLGLYAEEFGPSGEHLGNFPQAFTHLALISAAYTLNRKLDGL